MGWPLPLSCSALAGCPRWRAWLGPILWLLVLSSTSSSVLSLASAMACSFNGRSTATVLGWRGALLYGFFWVDTRCTHILPDPAAPDTRLVVGLRRHSIRQPGWASALWRWFGAFLPITGTSLRYGLHRSWADRNTIYRPIPIKTTPSADSCTSLMGRNPFY